MKDIVSHEEIMAELQPGVQSRLESPTPGEEVNLIVGVTDASSEEVIDTIEEVGGDVEERLYYESLVVSIEETNLDELCSLDIVTTVEIEGVWKPMEEDAEGNSESPTVSTR